MTIKFNLAEPQIRELSYGFGSLRDGDHVVTILEKHHGRISKFRHHVDKLVMSMLVETI